MQVKKKYESAGSRLVASNRYGKITKARLRDNILAFYPIDDDGKNDDCIYFFKWIDGAAYPMGWQWGRDKIEYQLIADGDEWYTAPGTRPTRDYVHTRAYQKELMDRVRKCMAAGIVQGESLKGEAADTHQFKHVTPEQRDKARRLWSKFNSELLSAGLELFYDADKACVYVASTDLLPGYMTSGKGDTPADLGRDELETIIDEGNIGNPPWFTDSVAYSLSVRK